MNKFTLNKHSIKLINDTFYEPVILSILNLLYRGIQFNLARLHYEDDNNNIILLSKFYQRAFNLHWKGLARRIGDWILRFGFVVIGKKKVKLKVTDDVKEKFPDAKQKHVLFPVPYIPEMEEIEVFLETKNGVHMLTAEAKDTSAYHGKLQVYQTNSNITEFSRHDKVFKTEMYVIANQYKRFLSAQVAMEHGIRSKFMPTVFVEPSKDGVNPAPNLDVALDAEVFFERLKEGEKKKRSRIFERDETVDDEEYGDVTDRARLLKKGLSISNVQPMVDLPANMEFHSDMLSKIAGNILGVPFQTITGGGKFSGSAKIDSRRTAASQQQLASRIQDIVKLVWEYFYEQNNDDEEDERDETIVFHIPVQTSFDIEDIVLIKEKQLVQNEEILNQLIESIAGNNAL